MGCFLGCFGFSSKRKRRKPPNNAISAHQKHGSYVPLDSNVIIKLDINSASKNRHKVKESSSKKIKKKVSFNLNVKAYEPLPNNNLMEEIDDAVKWEENEADKCIPTEQDPVTLKIGSYPSYYRYQNCRDSYEEVDDFDIEESHLDDDSHSEDGSESNDEQTTAAAFCKSTYSAEETLLNQEPNKLELSKSKAKGENVLSVLKPVENLTQWKAVKAKSIHPVKQQRKENIVLDQERQIPLSLKPTLDSTCSHPNPNMSHSKSLMQNVAVDASLSNWLIPV